MHRGQLLATQEPESCWPRSVHEIAINLIVNEPAECIAQGELHVGAPGVRHRRVVYPGLP